MLIPVLAHPGLPVAPHDVWWAWNGDPVILLGVLMAAGAYAMGLRGGRRRPPRWRRALFAVGIGAIAVALLSPLEAMSASLASAHMVQHVLLILVAAPALAGSAPLSTMLAGLPRALRRGAARMRAGVGLTTTRMRRVWAPPVAWLAHVVVLWIWHASMLYEAALARPWVHALEHAAFLGTALLFWGVVVGSRGAWQVERGQALLLVFLMAMQSVMLSVLLTFADAAWYGAYAGTTGPWGLEPLADQQLAGVIMWVPASAIYLGAVLLLLAVWLRESEVQGQPAKARR